MSKTNIEWTDRTWNPIAGCSIVSPGCTNCYAMRMAARIDRMMPRSHYEGLTKTVNGNPVWTGKVNRAPDHIFKAPLKWRKPTRMFVNSMSDLFHQDVPDDWIDEIFRIMAATPRHTYQILTKRPERMRDYARGWLSPISNVWMGVSVEDQARADERIPLLLETPAAVRFISAEPLLGHLGLTQWLHDVDCAMVPRDVCTCCDPREVRIDWVIAGGESGPGKRPVNIDWMRDIRDQCKAAGVPLFVKQIDKKIPIPDDLQIREFPT